MLIKQETNIDGTQKPSRLDWIVMIASLIVVVVLGAYGLHQTITPHEPDDAMIEMLDFAAIKSEAHTYVVDRLDRCPTRFKAKYKRCISEIVGNATIEKGGSYGDEVIKAINDVRAHFEEWEKAKSAANNQRS